MFPLVLTVLNGDYNRGPIKDCWYKGEHPNAKPSSEDPPAKLRTQETSDESCFHHPSDKNPKSFRGLDEP